jgi:PAS domain S-box-containing protein
MSGPGPWPRASDPSAADRPPTRDEMLGEAPDPVLWIREDGGVSFANGAACRFLGRDQAALLRTTLFAIAPGFSPERWPQAFRLLREEGPVTFDTHYLDPAGAPLFVEVTARHIPTRDGERVAVWARDCRRRRELEQEMVRYQDDLASRLRESASELARVNADLRREIGERKEVERTMRAWEDRYRAIADSVTDVVWSCDLEGNLTYVSPSAQRVFGYSPFDLVSMNLRDFLTAPVFASALRRLREPPVDIASSIHQTVETQIPVEMGIPHKLGHLVNCESVMRYLRDDRGRPIAIVGSTRDITERRRMEEALVRSERLAALGTLAAGIAHEFNNLNTIILGNADLVAMAQSLSPMASKRLDDIKAAAMRGATIAQNLISFGARDLSDLQPGSLSALADDALLRTEEDLRAEGISVVRRLVPTPTTLLSVGQMSQVIGNLLTNARHALLERPVKRIELETGTSPDGKSVYLTVSDTGCGIPKAHLSRVFSPFFSTKGEHSATGTPQSHVRGTGLGLSISHTIVSNHGGTLTVESREEIGATFTIRLPLAPPHAAGEMGFKAAG